MEYLTSAVSSVNMQAVLVANGLGLGLMIVLMLSTNRRGKVVSLDGRLFDWMCRMCLALCILETLSFWLDGRKFPGARTVLLGTNASLFVLNAIFSYTWSVYVDYKFYEDIQRLRKIYIFVALPAVLVCLMCLLNLVMPVFFWVSEDNVYYRTPLVVITYVVTYCYLTYGAVLVFRNRYKTNRYLFMPVMTFLVPIYLGSLIQLCCYGLALIWVSVAFGLTSLYINLQNEKVFLDTLTNLYNRSYLMHYMDYLARQNKKGTPVLGMMLDVNNFKYINDTYGHLAGDEVLQEVGKILQSATEGRGAVVRYGGDEFVILLEGDHREMGAYVREEITKGLARYNASGSAPCPISLSLGVSEFDRLNVDKFFRDMDEKMYDDKRAFYQQADKDRRHRAPERSAASDNAEGKQ